jgi:hypothetical protein
MNAANPLAGQPAAGARPGPDASDTLAPVAPPFHWVASAPDSTPPHIPKMRRTARNALVVGMLVGSWLVLGLLAYAVWQLAATPSAPAVEPEPGAVSLAQGA